MHKLKAEPFSKCEIKIHVVTRLSESLSCVLSSFSLPGIAHSQEAVVMVIHANALC